MTSKLEDEARETYGRFVAVREEIDEGARSWAELADFFTADAAYIDPAWGRIEGREAIRKFFVDSMVGLTGHGWSTPENWIMVEGPRVVSQWDQVLGRKEDGSPWLVAGLSILYYAGEGLFCYSHDMLNMTHIGQICGQAVPKAPICPVGQRRSWLHLGWQCPLCTLPRIASHKPQRHGGHESKADSKTDNTNRHGIHRPSRCRPSLDYRCSRASETGWRNQTRNPQLRCAARHPARPGGQQYRARHAASLE